MCGWVDRGPGSIDRSIDLEFRKKRARPFWPLGTRCGIGECSSTQAHRQHSTHRSRSQAPIPCGWLPALTPHRIDPADRSACELIVEGGSMEIRGFVLFAPHCHTPRRLGQPPRSHHTRTHPNARMNRPNAEPAASQSSRDKTRCAKNEAMAHPNLPASHRYRHRHTPSFQARSARLA